MCVGGKEGVGEGQPKCSVHGSFKANDVLKMILRLECLYFAVIARSN